MKHISLSTIVLVFFSSLIFTITATPITAKTITLTYATFRPPTDVFADPWLNAMGRELEEKSNHQLKFKVYWSGALGKGPDQFAMVVNGVADMCDYAGSWGKGKFTLSDVANLPLAAKNGANVIRAMNAMSDNGFFEKQWGEVVILTFSATPPYDMLLKSVQPMTVDGLKGLKIRSPGGYASKYLESLGMLPVSITPADAYMAWQTGVVDAWTNPPGALVKYKFNEIGTKAILDADLQVFGNAAMIINKQVYNSMSAELRRLLVDTARKYIFVYYDLGEKNDIEALAVAKNDGIDVYQMPEAEMARIKTSARPMWERYINDLEAKGLPGKAVVAEFSRLLKELGENPPY
jgi:TRAP-type C4-dicarboxylate transport system substrate-binding protein